MNTPKAFASFSPGLERSDNPGIRTLNLQPVLAPLLKVALLFTLHGGFPNGCLQSLIAVCVDADREIITITTQSTQTATTLEMTDRFISGPPRCLLSIWLF